MSDLIEHLKASGDLGQRAVKLIEQLLADSNIQQTRIAELEGWIRELDKDLACSGVLIATENILKDLDKARAGDE
jgi:hypothetical protein